MNVQIKSIKISHFKGIKDLEVQFSDVTNICGENATGKTSVFDSFLWLLFGKDSTGRKEFEVKHISPNGNGGPKDVEVEVALDVDDTHRLFKKIYREKWVKKRGREEAELQGHETICYVDDVTVTLKDFNAAVAEIVDEDVFKMLTNPSHFPSLPWKTQRDFLFELAGDIHKEDINGGNQELETLVERIGNRKTDDYRKMINERRKKLKTELDLVPARIDEVHRGLPEALDWDALEKELSAKQKELDKIEKSIEKGNASLEKEHKEAQERQQKIHEAKTRLSQIKHEVDQQNQKQRQEILSEVETRKASEKAAEAKEKEVNDLSYAIKNIEERLADLRTQWHQESARQFEFDPSLGECPTCQRPLEPEDIEEKEQKMRENFNKEKAHNLEQISHQGKYLKNNLEDLKGRLEKAQGEFDVAQYAIQAPPPECEEIPYQSQPGYNEAVSLIEQLEKEPQGQDDPTEDLKRERQVIREHINEIETKLSVKEQITKGQRRIQELEEQQQSLAQKIADLEKEGFLVDKLEKTRVEVIEKRVNSMFKITKWKLFETQLNGGEIPICEATHQGVPYSDLNSAARANVGLDIINTLSGHYGLTAPIFFDNREGVNNLIDTDSQLINLYVTKDKNLIIQN